ncbi:MAG TPA: hypothetical protein VIK77_00155 [Tissierellaceae bacterium]
MLQLIILSMIGRLLELVEITIYFKSIFVFQTILLSIFELLMILNILKGSIDYLELNYEGNLSLELEKKKKTYVILEIVMMSIVVFMSFFIGNITLILIYALMEIIIRIYVMAMITKLGRKAMEINSN